MNDSNEEVEAFDVFLCHHSEDKPEIRRISDDLINSGIKPWLDEKEIRPGTRWQDALEEQINSIKSVAVFVGSSGIGPWQNREILHFLNQFKDRNCDVIPVILKTAQSKPKLPWSLGDLHYVDFSESTPDPMQQLLWAITGQKPKFQSHLYDKASDGKELLPTKEKQRIELIIEGDLSTFPPQNQQRLLIAINNLAQINGEVTITARKPGSIRLFLELKPEDADKIYNALKNGQLENIGVIDVRLYPSLTDPPNEQQRIQLLTLSSRVKEFWIDNVLETSLNNEVLMSLGKRVMNEAIESRLNRSILLPSQRSGLSIGDTRIETVFDATGLLLILGEPGSGKTTTLLELASILIQRAKTDSKERIPIVLNLSSWTKRLSLTEWMINSLFDIYDVPVELSRDWLEKGYLIPLLDGLDEVKTEQQADCVVAINNYITQTDPAGLVVCSRLMEYQWLPERLKLNGAIHIEPLNRDQIRAYFNAVGTEYTSLQSAIQNDPILQELAQTPLMLNVMSLAYQSVSKEDMIDEEKSIESRRDQIFAAYVDRMLERKALKVKAFPKEKAIAWLSWLARQMTEKSQSVFFIENIQPDWLDANKHLEQYLWICSLMLVLTSILFSIPIYLFPEAYKLSGIESLFFVLADILIFALILRFNSPIKNGFMGALITFTIYYLINEKIGHPLELAAIQLVVLHSGLMIGVGIGTLNVIKNVESVGWSWDKFLDTALLGFSVVGIIIGFSTNNLTLGVIYGLICGLTGGVLMGATDATRKDKSQPNQGTVLSLKNGIYFYFITMLGFSIVLYLIFTSILFGLSFGLMIGQIVGFNRGLGAAVKHYALRLVLCINDKMPYDFIPFLNYCAKLILLKKVGGGYIFIHRMLLEYFAKLETSGNNSIKP